MPYIENLEPLLKDTDILTLISDRGGRKSSLIQDFLIKNALNGYTAVVLRSKVDEMATDNYFTEYIRGKYKNYTFTVNKIDRYINLVSMTVSDKTIPIFFSMATSVKRKYKSTYIKHFEKVKYIIYEECITEDRLSQHIDYINKYAMDEINSVFNIYSTVCRNNKAQLLFIGNDISYNIINPITVTFNLLERLKVNKIISDYCIIQGRTYKFKFLYFSFKNSVEHWMNYQTIDVNCVNIKNAKLIAFLKTAQKRYALYEDDGLFKITEDIKNVKPTNLTQLMKCYPYIFSKYNEEEAIIILKTFYDVTDDMLTDSEDKVDEIDLTLLSNLTLQDAKTNTHIYLLSKLKKDNTIFSNFGIKYIIENINNKYLFLL